MRFDFTPRRLFAPQTPEEAEKLNQEMARLIELYQKVDGYSLLQAQRMADTAKQSGTIAIELKKLNKGMQDNLFASDYLFRSFQEQTAELRNQNNILKIGKSLFNDLTDVAQKLTNFQKGYGDLNEKNFKKLQNSLKFQIDNNEKIIEDLKISESSRLKEIEKLKKIEEVQGKLNKIQSQKLTSLLKEEELYQASLDAQANGIPLLEKELSLSKQIYKTREDLGGLTKAAAGVIQQFGGSLAQYLDVSEAIEAVDEYNKKVIQGALEQDSVLQQLKRIEQEKVDLQNDVLDSYNIAADLLDIIKTKQTELNALTQLAAKSEELFKFPLDSTVSALTQKKDLVQNIIGSLDLEQTKQDEIIAKIDRQIALQEQLEKNEYELNRITDERSSLLTALTDRLVSQEQYNERINELNRKQAEISINNISLQRNLSQASIEVNNILRDGGELHTKINNKLSTQISLQGEINNLTSQQDFATQEAKKKEIGLADALAKKEEEAYKIKEKAIKDASTGLTGFVNKFKSLGVLIDNLNFTKVLTDPVVLMTTLVNLGFKANAQVVELGKSFGLSASEAENIRQDVAEFARGTGDTFITTDRLLKAQSELSKELGIAVKFSNEELATFAKLTELTGLSAQEAGKLAAASAAAGMPTEAYTDSLREAAFFAQQSTGTHFDSKEILQDVSKLSAGILVKFQGNPKAMAQTVVEAKKLGLTLEQIDKVGESLLNWESSIENELKAELMTGRQLNLERARAAALSGDQLTLTREISSQVGSLNDYQNMNVLAQKSLADAFGLSRDEMSEMLMKQEAINKYGNIAKDLNKEQLEDMKRQGLSASEYVKKQEQQQKAQDKFQDAMVKLQDIIGNLVAGPVGQLLDALANMVGFVMKIFGNPVVKFFFNTIAKTAELLSDMADSGLGKLVLGFGALALFLPKIVGGLGLAYKGLAGLGDGMLSVFKKETWQSFGKGIGSIFKKDTYADFFKSLKDKFLESAGLSDKLKESVSGTVVDKTKEVAAGATEKVVEAGEESLGDKLKDKATETIEGKVEDKAGDLQEKIMGGAEETEDKTEKVEGGSDGSKFKDKMKNIAEGIKAFGDGKVILGGLIGLPASAVGLIAMIFGVPGAKLIEKIDGPKFQEAMEGVAKGIETFGTGKVTGGALNLVVASAGLILMLPGALAAKGIEKLDIGEKFKTSLINIAAGIESFASGKIAVGSLMMAVASVGLIPMLVGALAAKGIEKLDIGEKFKISLANIAAGIETFASGKIAVGSLLMVVASVSLIPMLVGAVAAKGIEKLDIGDKFSSSMKSIAGGISEFGEKATIGAIGKLALGGLALTAFTLAIPGLLLLQFVNGSLINKALTGIGEGIHNFSKNVKWGDIIKAAASIALLGISLIPASIAFKMFSDVPWDAMAKAGVTLIGLGIAGKIMGSMATDMIKGAIAIALLGASLIPAAYALQMFADISWEDMAKAGVALLGLGIAGAAFGAFLPLMLMGAVGIAALGAALIPFSIALNIMAPAIEKFVPLVEAFGNVISKVFGGIATVITATSDGIVAIFTSLENVDVAKLLAIGPALIGIGIGLASLGAGNVIEAIGSFLGGGPAEKLEELAAAGDRLEKTSTALQAIGTSVSQLNSSLSALDIGKLLLIGPALASIKAGLDLLGGGGVSDIIASFVDGPVEKLERLANVGDKLQATSSALQSMAVALNEVSTALAGIDLTKLGPLDEFISNKSESTADGIIDVITSPFKAISKMIGGEEEETLETKQSQPPKVNSLPITPTTGGSNIISTKNTNAIPAKAETINTNIDLTPMIKAINAVKASVDKLYNKETSIKMDGKQIGSTLVNRSHKMA